MYNYLILIMLLCIGTAVTLTCIPLVHNMLTKSGMLRDNFRGEKIPVSMGIAFIPPILINGIILVYCNVIPEKNLNVFILLFAVMAMSAVGVIDDILGDRSVTGLKGHISLLLKGRLTTGGLKAVSGGLVGLCVGAAVSDSVLGIIISGAVVALSTNLINLFDLRPARAIKVYFLIAIFIFLFATINQKEIMAVVLPVTWAYFYYDAQAKSMMGDAGSNVLGVSIGVFIVEFFDIKVQIGWLIFVLAIHLLAEKFSISKIIDSNKFLLFLDQLGREKIKLPKINKSKKNNTRKTVDKRVREQKDREQKNIEKNNIEKNNIEDILGEGMKPRDRKRHSDLED